MDRIIIRGLRVRCIIGVREWEKRDRQELLLDVVLWTDLSAAGASDRLEDTVDYSAVKKEIIALAESSSFNLLEALAERVAAACLGYRGIERVRVHVVKPGALRFARSVAVRIERERAGK